MLTRLLALEEQPDAVMGAIRLAVLVELWDSAVVPARTELRPFAAEQ
jgi:hypothetical protein